MTMDLQPSRTFWSLRASSVVAFRVVVVGLMLSTGIGVVFALTQRARFVSGFPGAANSATYAAFLTVGVLGLFALIGLLRWRRWALGLYGVLAVASIGLDLLASAPIVHQLAVVVSAGTVFALAYLNRTAFGGSR